MSVQRFGEWVLEHFSGHYGPDLSLGSTLRISTDESSWHLCSVDGNCAYIPLDAIKALIAAHEAWLAKQEGRSEASTEADAAGHGATAP